MHYGLIGFPLTHSFSKKFFTQKFEREKIAATYENYPLETIEELGNLLREKNLRGFNVTIPYKESVIEFLDGMDEIAEAIGAVNCVKISDNKLWGYNTDVIGFRESLKNFVGNKKVKALLLGTGGSSKAVAHGLQQLQIPYSFVSRRKKAEWFTYSELNMDIMSEHALIINTTPRGMYPVADDSPDIPYQLLTPHHFLFDLIYNPTVTSFLQKGMAQGAQVKNGLEMLLLQAEENWRIWQEM